ncbi:MAG TPA: sigma-54 dependent transcriptional regulator [Candidatus Acidoferrales bacterium]|nr:sigma-54 dependent transcriptional regulator [Candidatus Acidoferrales bacterium]
MARRLLFVEQGSVPFDQGLAPLLTPDAGFCCERIAWSASCLDGLRTETADVVVVVAAPQTTHTAGLLHWVRDQQVAKPTLAVLPETADDAFVRSALQVADDFALCPIRKDEFRHRVVRLLGAAPGTVESVRTRLTEELGLSQLIGNDPAFAAIIKQLPAIARSGSPVLITGETGTGKELCARAIHHLSQRRNFPFIAVDCGALPEHLVENELFGHTRGAYTDAHHDQRGLIAMAEGGALFLDEIDALSLAAQSKLLRFLQERSFRPLGSDRFLQADVNIIAATNRDLESVVCERQFRADLFYRLNVLRLHLPPLRERRGDIGALATHFLTEHRATTHGPRSFSPAVLRLLGAHDWPGNARELQNVVQRAIVVCDGTQILPSHIGLPRSANARMDAPESFRQARALAVATFEHRYVEDLLRKHRGNVTRAAREAQKERRTFGRLLKKYNIDRYRP